MPTAAATATTAASSFMLRADHADVLYHAAGDAAAVSATTTASASDKFHDPANFYSRPFII